MVDHTSTPWRVSSFEQSAGGTGRVIMGADNFSIAHVMDRTPAENEVDAAHIVKAVNSHEALVKALQDMLEFCSTQGDFKNGVTHNCIDEGDVWASGVFDEARRVLVAVGGGQQL